MGSYAGQEVEAPVHRVWVDCFAMAATQVTVAEYARFLDASGGMPPPFWDDANFSLSTATRRGRFVVRRRCLLRVA